MAHESISVENGRITLLAPVVPDMVLGSDQNAMKYSFNKEEARNIMLFLRKALNELK